MLSAEDRDLAISTLIPLLADDDRYDRVSALILPLGEKAVPALVRGLESEDPMQRAWCGSLLLRLGTYGRGATLALFDGMRRAIKEEEEATLWTLTQALNEINPKAIGAAEVLSVAIEDPTLRMPGEGSGPDTSVVCAAIGALSKLGTAARPAIPILRRALTDPDADVRAAAKQALNRLR